MDGREPDRQPIIESTQAEAFAIIGGDVDRGVIVLCDHASNALPPEYKTLGLAPSEFARHIAFDIGAENVTRLLAARLAAPAVLSRFSRLLIDPNRGLDDPTLIMRISDGAVIEGNRHLNDAERKRRIARFYAPYHDGIAQVIDAHRRLGVVPILVSIHSFTPTWKGTARPWHAGILWDRDPRLAQPLLTSLRAVGHHVGDNEPYSGVLRGDTLWQHGTQAGLAHAIVEIRQDLIAHKRGQNEWAATLVTVIEGLLATPVTASNLRHVKTFGSRSDPNTKRNDHD